MSSSGRCLKGPRNKNDGGRSKKNNLQSSYNPEYCKRNLSTIVSLEKKAGCPDQMQIRRAPPRASKGEKKEMCKYGGPQVRAGRFKRAISTADYKEDKKGGVVGVQG